MDCTVNVCQLCGGDLQLAAQDHPGYVEGKTYRIWHCSRCATAVADPTTSDSAVYQAIYRQAARVPGYSRYFRYAEEILKQHSPWRYLRSREECYWGIGAALEQFFPGKDIAVLEAGCGMGYLTYALTRAGYRRVLGVDVAVPAIEAARARFACDYAVADIATFASETSERFDVIVMTEVLEHLEHPVAFVADAKKLLKPGGYLICTTPSRDFGGHPQQVWASDLPPVHLWWFTERGLTALSRQLAMSIRFVDFSAWNRGHFPAFEKALSRSRKSGKAKPLLSAEGAVIEAAKASRKSKPLWLELLQSRIRRLLHGSKSHANSGDPVSRTGFICAVFQDA